MQPDERWLIDYGYIWVAERWEYLLCLMDEHSRYVVHCDLGLRTDETAARAALDRALALLGRIRESGVQADNGRRSRAGSSCASLSLRALRRSAAGRTSL